MLSEIYEMYKETLSKSEHRIFSYLLEHEQELPVISSDDIARQLGVSTSTISRFWTKIGFKNLKDLKRAVYENQSATPFSRLSGALSQWGEEGVTLDFLMDRMSRYMEKTFRVVTPQMLDQAVQMILDAGQIYMFAPDASRGIGALLQYRLRRLGIRIEVLPSGSQIYDFMVNLKEGDLLILYGYSRILTEARILLEYGARTGCRSILFTDILAGDLLSQANLVLYSFRGEPNDYHFMGVPVILTDLLVTKTIQALGVGLEKARKLEDIRSQFSGLLKR